MEEIWKDIKGYEGKYQVSNLGRVKSLTFRNKNCIKNREKFLKAGFDRKGYLKVGLYKNNEVKTKTIHRLVMETFRPTNSNKMQIDHINGIKTDNRLENLEWVTLEENLKRAKIVGLRPKYKKVIQIELKTNKVINIYENKRQASIMTKIDARRIGECCNGKKRKAGGFIWRYADDENNSSKQHKSTRAR